MYPPHPRMQRRLERGAGGEAWGLLLVLRTRVQSLAYSIAALQKPLILIFTLTFFLLVMGLYPQY